MSLRPQEKPDFDRFLSAVKLLAEAELTSVDFDDFAMHFETAVESPLFNDNPWTFVDEVQQILVNGLDEICQLMKIGREMDGVSKLALTAKASFGTPNYDEEADA